MAVTVNDPGVRLDHLADAFARIHRGRTVKAKQLPNGLRVYGMQQSSGPDTLTIEGSVPKALHGHNLVPVTPDEAKDYVLNEVIPSVVGRIIPPEYVRTGNTETDTDFSLDMAQVGDVLEAMAWTQVRDNRGNVERKVYLNEDRDTVASVVRSKGTLHVNAYDKQHETGITGLDRPLRVEATHRRDRMRRHGVPTLAEWDYDTVAALHADAVDWAGFTAEFVSEQHWFPRVHERAMKYLKLSDAKTALWWLECTMHNRPHRLSRNTANAARRHVARMGIVLSKTGFDYKLDFVEGRVVRKGSKHRRPLYTVDTTLEAELIGLMAG